MTIFNGPPDPTGFHPWFEDRVPVPGPKATEAVYTALLATAAATGSAAMKVEQSADGVTFQPVESLYEECLAIGPALTPGVSPFKPVDALKMMAKLAKERDDANAELNRLHVAYRTDIEMLKREISALRNASTSDVSALSAEVQRLHDILGRAGVSFDAGTPQPDKAPFPARALRKQGWKPEPIAL